MDWGWCANMIPQAGFFPTGLGAPAPWFVPRTGRRGTRSGAQPHCRADLAGNHVSQGYFSLRATMMTEAASAAP